MHLDYLWISSSRTPIGPKYLLESSTQNLEVRQEVNQHIPPLMTWQPIDRINQAFLALEFAVKVMNYVGLGKINKDELDCTTLIQLKGGTLRFDKSAFNSYDDLIHASENLYSQALAASAIAMEAALQ